MRSIYTIFVFVCIFFSTVVLRADSITFIPKGDILGTKYRYGVLNIDDKGIKISAIAISNKKRYYAFFKDTKALRLSDYTLVAISSSNNMIALGFVQNDNAYNNHIVLLSTINDNLTIIDQVGGGVIANLPYHFTMDISPITVQKKLKSVDDDKADEIELDFSERQFRLLLDVTKDGFVVDLNSKRYLTEILSTDISKPLDEYQFREYLLYSVMLSKLSYKEALEILKKKNLVEADLRPIVISQAIKIKSYADEFKIGGDILVAYFSGQAGLDDLQKILSSEPKSKADDFIKLVTSFESELSKIGIDEVIFNDFAEFFLGKIDKTSLKKYVDKSFGSIRGDMTSILENYKNINNAIHNTTTRFYLKEFYGK